MSENRFFVFNPIFKSYIWGGKKLVSLKKASLPRIAESWEITDRKEGESVVSEGALQGKTLQELIALQLFTEKVQKVFPLLIKLIDAKKNLSIQVHPNEGSSKKLQAEPKTEMWYILDAEKNAAVYAGFLEESSMEQRKKSLGKKEMLSSLRKISVKKGDIIYIPGGRVHAILEGCFLLEIQQNSNTTYRIYDWDRNDADRPLHLQEANYAINWEDTEQPLQKETLLEKQEGYTRYHLLTTPYFTLEKWEITKEAEVPLSYSFSIFFQIEGSLSLEDHKMESFRAYLFPFSKKGVLCKGKAILICVTHK